MMRLLIGTIISSVISVGFALDPAHEQLIERIRPLGEVRVEGGQSQAASPAAVAVKPETRTGEDVYKQHCTVCHATGVAGAPKFHNSQEWHDRLAKGMKTLLEEVTHGFNAMPPMGTCQECTQEELKKAIEYMAPKS